MIRDVSDAVSHTDTAATANSNAIANLEEMWEEKTIGTTKLLEPSSNDVSGILLWNTIIKGTDLSGITIGDNCTASGEYAMALGIGADASGTGHFMYRDSCDNTFVFDSSGDGCVKINGLCIGGSIPGVKCSYPGDEDIVVKGTAEASGMILAPIQSAEGTSQSAIVCLDPAENPLMAGGMYWLNEAQDASASASGMWRIMNAAMRPGAAEREQGGTEEEESGRFMAAAAALGGRIYVVGGSLGNIANDYGAVCTTGTAEMYDPIDDNWTYVASEPLSGHGSNARCRHGMAALGGKLYVVGGSRQVPNLHPGGQGAAIAGVEVFDPTTDSWLSAASMIEKRANPGVAAMGGKLYAVGGASNWSEGARVYTATKKTAEHYDPIDNSWSHIASMKKPRWAPGVAALGGKLYAVGGLVFNDGGWWGSNAATTATPTAEVYDPIDNSWNYIPDYPVDSSSIHGRWLFGMAALGGKLYMVGGFGRDQDGSANILNTGYMYDPMNPSGGWTDIPSLSDGGRAGISCVALGGKLYVVGGVGKSSEFLFEDYMDASYGQVYDPSLVPMPQFTHQGEDFYVSAQRGGPKTFVIPHPEYEGKMLRHACLEAPTRGTNVYEYQFEATEENQTTTIPLPSYFKHINGRVRVYVSAGKGKEWSGRRGKVNEELTSAIIKTEKSGTFNVMVTGIRKDPEAVAYSATENIDDPIDAKDI